MDGLHPYIVTTILGDRVWWAEDAAHAREQHTDAFGTDDPDETIMEVRIWHVP